MTHVRMVHLLTYAVRMPRNRPASAVRRFDAFVHETLHGIMKKLILVLVPLLFFAFGCTGDSLVGPNLDPSAGSGEAGNVLAKKEVKYVPYKASWVGWADPSVDLDVECGDLYLFKNRGEGEASHMGYATGVGGHCIDFATGEVTKGIVVVTADNGDLTYWTYGGQAYPDGTFRLDLELTGGTGRFENATSRDMRIEGAPGEDGAIVYTQTGWISTVGSSK